MQHPLGKSLSVITELIMDARLPVFLTAFPDRAGAVVVGFLLDPPIFNDEHALRPQCLTVKGGEYGHGLGPARARTADHAIVERYKSDFTRRIPDSGIQVRVEDVSLSSRCLQPE